MKKHLSICVCLLMPLICLAQQTRTIRGKVLDAETGKPVSFASVGLQHQAIGTVSNEEGEFDFHVPYTSAKDTLVISFMGYQSHRAAITNQLASRQILIKLRPVAYALNEVIVRAKKQLSAEEIVRLAKKKIPDNYPVEPFKMSAYFRSSMKVNDNYVLYTDAAADIYDKTYKHAPINEWSMQEQVILHQVRQSHYQPLKAIITSLDTAPFDENNNPIQWLLIQNAARYRCQALHVGQYTYEIDSLLQQEGKLLYVIGAKVKHKKLLGLGRIDNTNQPAYQLFIDAETYAIHKIIYKPVPLQITSHKDLIDLWIAKESDSIESYILGSKFEMVVDYQEIEGKMYPHYFKMRNFYEDYHAKKQQVLYHNEHKEELLINEVQTAGVEFPNQRKLMNPKKGLARQAPAYKKDFWKHYNAVKMTSLDEKLIKDLGGGLALEKQFRNIKSLPRIKEGVRYRYVKRG